MPYKFLIQLFADESVSGIDSTPAENVSSDGVATEGTTDQVATGAETQPTWDELIKGQYKKEYNQAVKDAVNKRFKNQRDLQGQIDSIDPMVRALAQKYGVNANEDGSIPIEALTKMVLDDNSMYEEEAFQRGMSVQDLKQLKQLEAENKALRSANQRTEEQKEWDAIVSQGEALKQIYPEFDLDMEMGNAQFGRLLATMQRSGFPNPVQTAYEAVHREEIMSGAMRYAVSQTEQKISNSIQSGMRKPTENLSTSQSAATVPGSDPSRLTLAQIQDIKKRAERGERISFG